MQRNGSDGGPIMRLFEARAKPGSAGTLLQKFASTSADVVRGEPGNEGYFFGHGVARDDGVVFFASMWSDLASVKARFGADWQLSFLPEGYEDLIDECSVRHIDVSAGWHVGLDG